MNLAFATELTPETLAQLQRVLAECDADSDPDDEHDLVALLAGWNGGIESGVNVLLAAVAPLLTAAETLVALQAEVRKILRVSNPSGEHAFISWPVDSEFAFPASQYPAITQALKASEG